MTQLLLCLFAVTAAYAQPMRIDFRQAANNDSPYPAGDVHWIQSILQSNNATYYEGMSVPQRIMLVNIPSTPGNTHTLTFSHKATKGGRHAYDFLTSYSQAKAAANAIVGATVLQNLNECGTAMGPPQNMPQTCNEIRINGSHYPVTIPNGMGSLLGNNVADRVSAYESRFGSRSMHLHGNETISTATLTFDGYTSGQDATAEYTLSWTSSSTSLLIEFAGHLAMGSDVIGAGTGLGYGVGMGAGSISGGSYHVRLDALDGDALGARDNQIMGATVRTSISCGLAGPSPVCMNEQNQYSFNSSVSGLSYSWSLVNNTSGATMVGPTTGPSISVDAGNAGGAYTVSVVVRDAVQTVLCQLPVTVNGFTVTATPQPLLCAGNKSPVTVSATGGQPPYTGTGTFLKHAGTHTLSVTDARGCTGTATVTILEPEELIASSTAGQLSCASGTTTVTVSARGGRPPYTGTGSFQRGAGNHSFTVEDANKCISITQLSVAAPPSLTISVNAPDVDCHGGTTTVTVTAGGGTPPFSGTGSFQRTAGTHSFTVTDANGCTETATVTIGQPASAMAVTASATAVSCFGGMSAATVTATGGTPPYTGTGSFQRTAGTYTFTVTDDNGCSASAAPITITQPAAALNVVATATPIPCNGGTSTVTVTATGGTPPYTGAGTYSHQAGSYTFTVTDANGCSASTAPVTISEPPTLQVSASAAPIDCYGGTTTVTVSATGGTPPYSGTGTFSHGAGSYTFTVTDANGCSATSSVTTLTEPAALSINVSATPILCYGAASTVTVTATGGTPPYTGTGSFQRTAGTYTFTVTDDNGCAASSAPVTLTQPPAALDVIATTTPILCNGGTSTVTVTATGGTPPYTGAGTYSHQAGTYTFTVTDANGCLASTAAITISEPPALQVSASAAPIDCYGGTTTVTVSATGGTPPYSGTGTFSHGAGSYTFTVTDANGCSATSSVTTLTEPAQLAVSVNAPPILCFGGSSQVAVSATGGTAPYTGTGTFARGPGTYTFTVTDANGCSSTSSSVTILQPPSGLSVSATATQILCHGDDATVTVTASGGVPPYTGVGSYQRGAGTYTFTVTDANGCQATTAALTLGEPPAFTVTATAPPIACNGGTTTVTVSATGGTPPHSGTGTFTRGAGTYTFTVTDANGCTASSAVTTLTEPAQLVVDVTAPPIACNGGTSTVTVSASGGTAPYSGTGIFTMGSGSYTFTVIDANGCSAVSSAIVLTDPPLLLASASATSVLCYGDLVTVTVNATGGTPPYTGTGTFSAGAGSVTYTVTDANGCTDTANISITQPPLLAVNANASTLACGNDSTAVTVSASGGTPPYIGTGSFYRGLGTHTFVVTDANGCSDSAQVTVTGPPPLFAAANTTPILCYGDLSTITVTAWGGTPPYTGTGSFQNGAGTYTFVVSDANGCSDNVVVSIIEPPALVVNLTAPPIPCNGGTTTITVSASGGTPPHTGTGTFTRGPGTWIFTVVDGNGCSDSASITLMDPPPVTAASSATPILCYGETSIVTVTASGGTPPYSGTGIFPMGAGTWTFGVTDANGCTANTTVTITEPPVLAATATTPTVLCGRDSAVIQVGATGGTPPYTGTGFFTRIAGSYTFVVTDANGCTDTVQATVAGPPPLFATAGSTPILCNGGTSLVTVSAWGGTPPYTGTGTFTVLAGTYTYIVSDANNCTDTVTITIVEPPPLLVSCRYTDCVNGVRTLIATATGGTPTYTYYWMPFGTTGATVDVPCNYSGTVTLRVRDANWTSTDPNNSACEAWCSLAIFSKDADVRAEAAKNAVAEYALFENYPNPFNPSTTIRYFLPEPSHVRLTVINTLGRTITTLVDADIPGGLHEATWNAGDGAGGGLPSGSYIYRIHATSKSGEREFVQERLMLLLK